ncbi:MAG: PorV/PorQ family protein [bacterium]
MRTITSWFVNHLFFLREPIAKTPKSEGDRIWRMGFGVVTFVLLGMEPLRAQEGLGSSGAFMRQGIGARAGSLGDAYVAAATGPEAIYWNPAALAVDPSLQFALTQRRYAFDRNFSFAGLSLPVSGRSAVGLSWTGFGTSGLEARTGNTQTPDVLFNDDENAFAATFGHRLSSWLYAGVAAKFISQKLSDRSATGYGAGVSFLFKPLSRVAFGLALQDLFASFKWDANQAERLPSTMMLGMSWQVTPQALLTLDYHHAGPENLFSRDWWRRNGRVRAGTELRTLRSLPLRLGYSQNSFNAGAGFEVPISASMLVLDYQYGVQDGLNNNGHAFSVRFEFGGRRRANRSGDKDLASSKEDVASAGSEPEEAKKQAENSRSSFASQPAQTESANRVEVAQKRANKTPGIFQGKTVANGTWLTISSAELEVRSGPGTNYKILGKVYRDSRYEVLRQHESWFQVRWNGNQLGWVKADAVTRKKIAER